MASNDRILIEGISFFGYHGVLPEEQVEGRYYEVDVTLDMDLTAAGESDDLHDTLDYRQITARTVELGTQMRFNLLERLARVIGDGFLDDPRVDAVTLRVRKLSPGLHGDPPSAAVEIYLTRP